MRSKFIKFSLVGTIGFLVDASVLTLLLSSGYFDLYMARVGSFFCAVTATWYLNRQFTFPDSKSQKPLKQWRHFISLNAVGGGINYLVYALLVTWSILMSENPVLATAIGSICGLSFNFLASYYVIFKETLKPADRDDKSENS
ncbi:MAG: GtrA family protein [Emcibacter sp.]|nr:GtrA family protein [Emcibacter sp.]